MRVLVLAALLLSFSGCMDGQDPRPMEADASACAFEPVVAETIISAEPGMHSIQSPAGGLWTGRYAEFPWASPTRTTSVLVEATWGTSMLGQEHFEVLLRSSEGTVYATHDGPSGVAWNLSVVPEGDALAVEIRPTAPQPGAAVVLRYQDVRVQVRQDVACSE